MKHEGFTPGPWLIVEYTVCGDGRKLADLSFGRHGASMKNSNEERAANLSLIAAAPDLLSENERLRAVLDKLQAWFSSDLGGAFSNSEYLLGGCPNELRSDVLNARAALAASKG